MKAAIVFILWLLLGLGFWYASSKCCGDSETSSISDTTQNVSSYTSSPIIFAKDAMTSEAGQDWLSYKDSLLNELGDNQLVEIRANAFANESKPEVLKQKRAEEIQKLLGLPNDRVKISSDVVSEDFDSTLSLVYLRIVDEEPKEKVEPTENLKTNNANTATAAVSTSSQEDNTKAKSTEKTEYTTASSSSYSGDKVIKQGAKTIIYYDRNSTNELKDAEVQKYLARIARSLQNNLKRVYVTGHTDNEGSDAFNYNLGRKRAERVENYLIRLGVSPQRIETYTRGEKAPIETNDTEEGREKNRRIELRIVN